MRSWWFKEKMWSGDRATITLGYDLTAWALPLLVDKDYGEVRLRVLCIFLYVAWNVD